MQLHKTMKLTRYFLLLMICCSARAGDNPALTAARTDLKKTNEAYSRLAGLSMDTYYIVYDDHRSQSAMEGKNGRYVKFGEHVYTKIDGIETYAIDDKLISINPDNKQITVGDNKPLALSPLQTNLDTLLTLCEDIKVEWINSNEKKYKLYFDDSYGFEYSRVDIHIDTKNLRYVKIVLYYAMSMNLKQDFYAEGKQPRLEIVYKNFRPLEADPAIFDQDLYIQSVNGKLKPASKYYNFKVSDLRNQTKIKIKK
jgi:hypothetical protein